MKSVIRKIGILMTAIVIVSAMLPRAQTMCAEFVRIPMPSQADFINVSALNNNGEIVGRYGILLENGMEETTTAFKWSKGELETLDAPDWGNICGAFDINDNGDVVGYCFEWTEYVGPEDFIPWLWTEDELIDLREKVGYDSTATGINNLGHIVGDRMTEAGQRGYLLRGEELIEMGTLWEGEDWSIGSVSLAVNNDDQVVGLSWSFMEDLLQHAYKWTPESEMIDLELLDGFALSEAYGINDNGYVIGVCGNLICDEFGCFAGNTGAFIHSDDTGMTPLENLADKTVSNARGINNRQMIVGFCANETEDGTLVDKTPVLWSGGEVSDLREVIGVSDILTADDINDRGQIAGTAYSPILGHYAFLWTPVIEVTIDIRPFCKNNCVNKFGFGLIPVAVFGGSDIDVRDIDLKTLKLQGALGLKTLKGNPLVHFKDLNKDGHKDLIVFFKNERGIFSDEDTIAILTGSLNDGTPIRGEDSIRIVP